MNDIAISPTDQTEPVSTETIQVDLIENGVKSEFCRDLSGVPLPGAFDEESDFAMTLGVLSTLRERLVEHGALSKGSGLLVRCLPDSAHPDDRAEELGNGGDIVESWRLTVELRRRTAPASVR